jgi:hypothetical protein
MANFIQTTVSSLKEAVCGVFSSFLAGVFLVVFAASNRPDLMVAKIFNSENHVRTQNYVVYRVSVEQAGEILKVKYRFRPQKRWRTDHLPPEDALKFMRSHDIDFDVDIPSAGFEPLQGNSAQSGTGSGSGVSLFRIDGPEAKDFNIDIVNDEGDSLWSYPVVRTLPILRK